MGLFTNNNTNRSIPDLSRYDYHYRGSHVNGYNVESGANTTASQYVRSMSLTNNGNHVKTYPQTRRKFKQPKNILAQKPIERAHSLTDRDREFGSGYYKNDLAGSDDYDDAEFDEYDIVDFDQNDGYEQQTEDDYHQEYSDDGEDSHSVNRYNSITSVTTMTTTTTKEVDPVTGTEIVTKTVEKTLPDGSVQTTIVRLQKPNGSSRHSSRNNSFVTSPTKSIRNDYNQPSFNGFSSNQYSNKIDEEEEEDIYYKQPNTYKSTSKKTRPYQKKRNVPAYTEDLKSAPNQVPIVSGRMTDAEMYARALQIAKEKVMSDPSRLQALEVSNQIQTKKGKKNKKHQAVEFPDESQIGNKKYEIPRSLRDNLVVDDKAELVSKTIETTKALPKQQTRRSSFNLFKMFKKKKNNSENDNDLVSLQQDVTYDAKENGIYNQDVATQTVEEASDSDIDISPVVIEPSTIKLQTNLVNENQSQSILNADKVYDNETNTNVHQPDFKAPFSADHSNPIVLANNNVVPESHYPAQKDINDIDLSVEPEEYKDALENVDENEIIKEDDLTELYKDVNDPMIFNDFETFEDHPDTTLLQDVPLLKTIQSENELRDVLENLEGENEVEVLKNISIINPSDSHEKSNTKLVNPDEFYDNDESKDLLESYESGHVLDSLMETNEPLPIAEFTDKKIPELKSKILEPNLKTSFEPDLINKSPINTKIIYSKPVTTIKSQKTDSVLTVANNLSNNITPVILKDERLPSLSQPVVTLNKPVMIEQPQSDESQNQLIENPNVENYESKNSAGKPSNIQRKKSFGLMSKIVQFSNSNYGVQVPKPSKEETQKDIKEKSSKKSLKWKLLKN
ncbi:hypothetical protein QEN19_001985 [Hanseniaspora menglaensis]